MSAVGEKKESDSAMSNRRQSRKLEICESSIPESWSDGRIIAQDLAEGRSPG